MAAVLFFLYGQIQRRGKAAPESSQTLQHTMQMKALTIPASRTLMRELMSAISATVSNIQRRLNSRACLTVATVAITVFFIALAVMHVPSIIVSGLTALTVTAVAPNNNH